MGVQKTFDSIKRKYFWPILFKDYIENIRSCVMCQTESLQKIRQPLQKTNIPPYSMAQVRLYLSGPHPTLMSGDKYIIAFVAWFSGSVAHLLLEEIFPHYEHTVRATVAGINAFKVKRNDLIINLKSIFTYIYIKYLTHLKVSTCALIISLPS